MFSIGKWKTKSLTVWNEFVTGMDWQAANPGSSRTTRVVTVVVCLLVCLFARFQSFDLYNYCFGEFDAVDISYQEHLTFCIIRCWIISICLNQTWLKECLYYVSSRGSRDTDRITTVPAWSYILPTIVTGQGDIRKLLKANYTTSISHSKCVSKSCPKSDLYDIYWCAIKPTSLVILNSPYYHGFWLILPQAYEKHFIFRYPNRQ